MIVTTLIAWFGLIIALISLIWQIYTHKQTHREIIKGKLFITAVPISRSKNVPGLKLQLYNDGLVPVYIKSVSLSWGDEKPKLGNTVTSLVFNTTVPATKPLQPGEEREYLLASKTISLITVASRTKKNLWISVESSKREVFRISTPEVKTYVDEMVKTENGAVMVERHNYEKEDRTCYMCEKLATSVEHIPPQCLFPEKKDLPDGVDLRKQLLTVPACDEHNSQKSQDDEYFLYSLAMLINSNNVARNLYSSKIRRAIQRNPSLFKKFAETASPVRMQNSKTGVIFSTHAFHLDEVRFNGIIDKLGRAIYYKHFNEKWCSHIKYQAEHLLATLDPEKSHELNEPLREISEEADRWFKNSKYYGENPEVFKYQVLEDDQSKKMRLYFYEGCKFLLIFTEGIN